MNIEDLLVILQMTINDAKQMTINDGDPPRRTNDSEAY